ncbi:uncharacterized protein LOC131957300 [Physella acuta]|uniref:uncharacterized protein LOC131957300 n=1 Tax=Physella acuta TaxID=109671 RepID=UPI0027DBB5F0|nr:uncharacterized protein LOC131957300 [Physella acuta]
MDKVIVFSILFMCMVYLPDMIIGLTKYPMEITGFERDCVNYSCRPTGKIAGSVKIFEKDIQRPTDCEQTIIVLYCTRNDNCSSGSKSWARYCDIFRVCSEPTSCLATNRFPCYCSGPYPLNVKFFPTFHNGFYRLAAVNATEIGEPIITFSASNIFDSSAKPARWNPVEDVGHLHQKIEHSTNGKRQLHSDFVFLCIGTLYVVLLA